MLKDRRVLLEEEIAKAKEQAARLYLDIVTHAGDTTSEEYQALKTKIMNLQFDLSMVNRLIDSGSK
jgi:cellobiose-specific phosphotransferase system component IIA